MGKTYELLAEPLPAAAEVRRLRHRRTWAGDAQGATNDSQDYDPRLVMKDGYPIIYSCEEAFENVANLKELEITFDYEVTIRNQRDSTFEENLRELEWSVLWNVAQATGVSECELEIQQIGRRRKMLSVDAGTTYVAMLSSELPDHIDTINEDCISSDIDRSKEFCVPIHGRMTALHTGDDVEAVGNYLLQQTESVMGLSSVIVKDISQVVYQGDRAIALQNWSTRTVEESSDNATVYIGVAASVSMLFITVIAFFVRRSVKRASNEKEMDTMENSGAFLQSHPSTEVKPRRTLVTVRQTAPMQQPPLLAIRTDPNAKSIPAREQQTVVPIEPTAVLPAPTQITSVALAPANTRTAKSISLSTKRKRRKKKKKRRRGSLKPLTPLNEMETIHEAEEEERDDDEDCEDDDSSYDGSDCSSDDSSTLSRSSSSDSLRLMAPSPPISPMRNLFVDSPDVLKNNDRPPSSIPRLPPPWV